ncbi:hypothetical protein KI387_012284, partial [Taxus chinensis]
NRSFWPSRESVPRSAPTYTVGADFLGAAPIIKASPELSSKDRRTHDEKGRTRTERDKEIDRERDIG